MARLRQDYGAASAIDKAVRAQGGAVVKPHQVKAMILAARRAYKMQAAAGLVDDGVGFEVAELEAADDGETHLGIENTRMRLEAMCGGELLVESKPGSGTIITMRIPKKAGEQA